MNRIAIFLRKTGNTNKFRRAILGALRSDLVNDALLCSGFFQDDGKYSAGSDFDLATHRNHKPLTLTTLGLYSYSWKQQYASFGLNLAAANCPCVSIVRKRMPGMRWHAKVFIARQEDKPLVGIIGSSNITRRAFGEFTDFNYECDVVMWEENNREIDGIIERSIGDVGDDSDVIVTKYDQGHRANRRPLSDRLVSLEKEILLRAIDS